MCGVFFGISFFTYMEITNTKYLKEPIENRNTNTKYLLKTETETLQGKFIQAVVEEVCAGRSQILEELSDQELAQVSDAMRKRRQMIKPTI